MNSTKLKIRIILALFIIIAIISCFIFFIESNCADSNIKTPFDVIWYDIVTITTVGYGDKYPVTMIGKILGIFIILSTLGIITFAIGLLFDIFNNEVFPKIFLFFNLNKDKDLYIFDEYNDISKIIIAELQNNNNNNIFIVLNKSSDNIDESAFVLFLNKNIFSVINFDKISCKTITFLLCKNDQGMNNFIKAKEILNKFKQYSNLKIFVDSTYSPEKLDEKISLFNKFDNIARLYWKKFPIDIENNNEKIFIIGKGRIAKNIFKRGFVQNTYNKKQNNIYYIDGDTDFVFAFHKIVNEYHGDRANNFNDNIIIMSNYKENCNLLKDATRIILCDEDENTNYENLCFIKEHLLVNGDIYIYYNTRDNDIFDENNMHTFGQIKDVYKLEYVMKDFINNSAKKINEEYRKLYNSDKWNDLSTFYRESNISAADHLDIKMKLLFNNNVSDKNAFLKAYEKYNSLDKKEKDILWEIEHERWCRFYFMNNWEYGETKNVNKHNCLMKYDDLIEDIKKNDSIIYEILKNIA